jgi:hypothetical protein
MQNPKRQCRIAPLYLVTRASARLRLHSSTIGNAQGSIYNFANQVLTVAVGILRDSRGDGARQLYTLAILAIPNAQLAARPDHLNGRRLLAHSLTLPSHDQIVSHQLMAVCGHCRRRSAGLAHFLDKL